MSGEWRVTRVMTYELRVLACGLRVADLKFVVPNASMNEALPNCRAQRRVKVVWHAILFA